MTFICTFNFTVLVAHFYWFNCPTFASSYNIQTKAREYAISLFMERPNPFDESRSIFQVSLDLYFVIMQVPTKYKITKITLQSKYDDDKSQLGNLLCKYNQLNKFHKRMKLYNNAQNHLSENRHSLVKQHQTNLNLEV